MSSFASKINPPQAELTSFPQGANSPAQSAIVMQKMNAEYQNKLTKMGGKKSRKSRKSRKQKTKLSKRKSRKGGAIPIYTPPVSYPEVGTGSNTVGSINQQVTQNLMQGEANSQYDKMASLKKGGGVKTRLKKTRHNIKKNKNKTKKRVRFSL